MLTVCVALGSFTVAIGPQPGVQESLAEPSVSLSPASMPRIGTIDERFQSYNVEMLEVTGGTFWRPYGPEFDAPLEKARRTPSLSTSGTPAGMDPALYQYRPPIDLKNPLPWDFHVPGVPSPVILGQGTLGMSAPAVLTVSFGAGSPAPTGQERS